MTEEIKNMLYDALIKKYDAEIADAESRMMIYFSNPVAIGEHPQHTEEIDKLVDQLESANGKRETLVAFGKYRLNL